MACTMYTVGLEHNTVLPPYAVSKAVGRNGEYSTYYRSQLLQSNTVEQGLY